MLMGLRVCETEGLGVAWLFLFNALFKVECFVFHLGDCTLKCVLMQCRATLSQILVTAAPRPYALISRSLSAIKTTA